MDITTPLTRLETTELVRRLNDAELAYLFKHALVQDTAYTSLLKNERKRLHRMIGETLEREYPSALEENAALLTKHFLEAGDDAKILEYGVCAGDVDARIFAKPEAIEHYSTALDAAIRLQADRETIIELTTKLGRMYELHDDYTNALATYARLSTLAETYSDPRYELAALMLQATVRATPTAVFEPQIGREICDRALVLARELHDGAAEAKILWNLLLVNGFTGHHRAAVEYGEQSLALARALNLKTQIAYTLNDIGTYGYFSNGELEKSHAALAEARGLWRELEILPMLGDNLNNSGILEYMRGNYAQAQIFSDEALAISERISSLWGQSLARTFRGLRQAEAGDYGASLSELQTAYDLARRSGAGIVIITATNLALAYSVVGEIQLGYDVIQIADQEIEIQLYRAPAKAALAYLTFLRGDTEHARAILQVAHPRSAHELEFSYLPSIIAEGEIGLADGRAQEVVQYTETLGANLLEFGMPSFVADADLYRGRALTVLQRYEEARSAFERAETLAKSVKSKRTLWQIYLHWSRLEYAANNNPRASELEERANAMIQAIAATLPESYRAPFLSGAYHT